MDEIAEVAEALSPLTPPAEPAMLGLLLEGELGSMHLSATLSAEGYAGAGEGSAPGRRQAEGFAPARHGAAAAATPSGGAGGSKAPQAWRRGREAAKRGSGGVRIGSPLGQNPPFNHRASDFSRATTSGDPGAHAAAPPQRGGSGWLSRAFR